MDSMVNLKSVCDDFEVQFEIVTSENEDIDERKKVIKDNLEKVDHEMDGLQVRIDALNAEIEKLTNHADGIDYMVAVGSGIIAGVIDILFVDDLSFEQAHEWGQDKTDKFVVKVAKMQGYKGDDVDGAILYLAEGKKHKGGEKPGFHLASDSNTPDFGGGTQHHLRDFAHHPTLVGLAFSMLTQFTSKSYGTNTQGIFIVVDVKNTEFIGKDLPHKFLYGMIFWFFHMISDVAGSGGTISGGTGIPGPIGSFLKEISALPIFKKVDGNGNKEFSVWVAKLFNGTLLGERDKNGKLQPIKFDLRTEIGLLPQLANQALSVIVNECLVRGFYFLRRLYIELKEKNIQSISELNTIDWKKTLPFKNRTVIRMLTISSSTMVAIDLVDAAVESAVKSGGVNNPLFVKNMIVKVNFVGIGRFAVAVGSDINMGVKKKKTEREREQLLSQLLCMSNVKLYYKNADMLCELGELHNREADMHAAEADLWVEVEKTGEAVEDLYSNMEKVGKFYIKTIQEMDDTFDEIEKLLPEVEKMNPGIVDKMFRRLS